MKTTIEEVGRLARPAANIVGEKGKKSITSLLTDSRSLLEAEGTLFFAIPTATNSGTRYMRELYDRGVRMFVAPEVPENMKGLEDAVIILDEDPIGLLQRVAAAGRCKGKTEVVAITGSVGKTTLKEWLFQLLEPLRSIVRSPRSFNSQIGVPLSLWEMAEDTDLALIEAGISRMGEMARLRECIQPDTVVITAMNDEHSAGFPSRQAKVAEKVSLAENAARIIYSADDEDVVKCVEKLPASCCRISWSLSGRPASLQLRLDSGGKISYVWHEGKEDCLKDELTLPEDISAEEYAATIACALALMLAGGYDRQTIGRRFSRIHPVATRLSVSEGGMGCNIVYDSYTSDYTSLLPAVDFMMRRQMPGQKSVVVLSDLRHESHGGRDDYKLIASLMKGKGIDLFIGIGKNLKEHAHLFGEKALLFADTAEALKYLRSTPLSESVVLLKGAPEFDFHLLKEALEVRTHETVLEVNLDAMIRNYNYFKSHLPAECGMIAMVKASGYGAGSYEIAKTLQDAGAAYLAVAVLDEGIDLRRQGITMPIMVMNPRVADYGEMFRHRLEPEIYSARMLEDVIEAAERCGVEDYPIHIKLDTGMHRMGFLENELPMLMERIAAQNRVRISSTFSHLATADEPSMDDYTELQLEVFDRATNYMLSHCPYPFKRHVLNSAGILRYGKTHHYDMARLGIGLYGVNTLPLEMERPLDVVSSLKTVIFNIREWPAGTTIGYARRGHLERDSRIATIPIGYADGMLRCFGNGAIKVLVNGKEAPTCGNICMDACMIDVTGIDCRVGDRVEIFGREMPVSRMSDVAHTIPYEILTSVSPRVKRVYFRE